MTVISRQHKLKDSIWQWCIQKGEEHWFGTVAYLNKMNRWTHVSSIVFDNEKEFHDHVDTFVNGFEDAE